MKLWTAPAVVDGKPETTRKLASAGLTTMPDCIPEMLLAFASLAVIDWAPAVLSVTEVVAVPLVNVSVAGEGKIA